MFDDQPRRAPSSEEVSLALRHCWQPVARMQDLAQGPQRVVLLGEALAVFLTESGKPAVVADRCAHRGASLSMGKVEGDAIQCPYHGWEWGGNGACTRIPSLPDQNQIPDRARIPAFPAREHWGLVWTVLAEPLGELPTMPWFDADEWIWDHGRPFELPVSFGIMIENFRDVAHFAFVHQDTLGEMPETIEPLHPERDGFRVTLRRDMTAGDGADAIWGSLRALHTHVIAPNFTSGQILTVKGERCLLHAARAISATESAHYWIAGITKDYDEFSVAEAIDFEQRLYDEDCAIISAVQPPELPLDPEAEANTLADRFTLSYRRAFRDYVERALSLRIPG